MNKEQRKELQRLITRIAPFSYEEKVKPLTVPQVAEMMSIVDSAKSDLEDMQSDERDKYYNMPPGLQNGPGGKAMQEAIDYLENAAYSLSDASSASLEEPGWETDFAIAVDGAIEAMESV